LAIWLTKERAQPGPAFGNIDRFTGLGIFLDTYANARHAYSFPRINVMLGDGKKAYNVGTDGDKQTLAGCSANYRRTNVATKIKITYIKDKYFDIKLHYKAWDNWMNCLSIKNITLPTTPYLGFTALTGDVFDAHDIISVTSLSAILAAPNSFRDNDKATKGAVPAASGPWLFFFKLIVFSGVCAAGFYGYKEYKRRQTYGGYNSIGMAGAGGGFGGGMYQSNKRF